MVRIVIFLSLTLFVTQVYGITKVERLTGQTLFPDFALQITDQQSFTKKNLLGHWTLMTIGFTSCPDVCLLVLSNLEAISKTLVKEYSISPQIVFVGIDPKRDASVIQEYVKHFGEDIVGITGEHSELEKVADAMGAAYQLGKPDKSGTYSVKHTAFAVLVSPNVRLVARLNPPVKAGIAAAELFELISAENHASH